MVYFYVPIDLFEFQASRNSLEVFGFSLVQNAETMVKSICVLRNYGVFIVSSEDLDDDHIITTEDHHAIAKCLQSKGYLV